MDEQEEVDIDVDVFEQPEAAQPVELELRWVVLPPSTMLTVENADELLRRRPASVISVVGERNGGKTTLVTELYERYLRGPFANAYFADSISLIGFEKKSFQSRAKSGAELPNTPRTSAQDGLGFFHLAVASQSDLQRTDLLISERAGEVYREVRDKPDLATRLIEIRKANVLVFIIDGERVSYDLKRAEVFASVRNIARAFVGSETIGNQVQIQLVTTKWDLLESEAAAHARVALSAFEEQFTNILGGRFEVATFHTTARDPRGSVGSSTSLEPLLLSWLQPPKSPPSITPQLPVLLDEFDRLALRRIVK
ncbi:TRAFAC clade GTPase domain-containing protein [Pseudomonas lini]